MEALGFGFGFKHAETGLLPNGFYFEFSNILKVLFGDIDFAAGGVIDRSFLKGETRRFQEMSPLPYPVRAPGKTLPTTS